MKIPERRQSDTRIARSRSRSFSASDRAAADQTPDWLSFIPDWGYPDLVVDVEVPDPDSDDEEHYGVIFKETEETAPRRRVRFTCSPSPEIEPPPPSIALEIPVCVWSEILEYLIELYIGDSEQGSIDRLCPEANWAPVRFSQVSRAFRRAAFKMTKFWSTICVGREKSGHYTSADLMQHMIEHSGAAPLTIIVDGGPAIAEPEAGKVASRLITAGQALNRWKTLVVYGEWTVGIAFDILRDAPHPSILRNIIIEGGGDAIEVTPFIAHLAKVSKVTELKWLNVVDQLHTHSSGYALCQKPWSGALRYVQDIELSCPVDVLDTLHLLSAAENLRTFKLDSLLVDPEPKAPNLKVLRPMLPAVVAVRNLESLDLSDEFDYFDQERNYGSPICQLLRRLVTPKLKKLSLGYDGCWEHNLFEEFTARCAPSLESLKLVVIKIKWGNLAQTLRTLQNVENLQIHTGLEFESPVTKQIIEVLTPKNGRPAEALPDLRDATFDDTTVDPDDIMPFVRMVRRRCIQNARANFNFVFVEARRSRDIVVSMNSLGLPNLRTE